MTRVGVGVGISFRKKIPPPPRVKFDLLENSLDFIVNGVILINQNSDNKRMKYVLLHLSSGMELIFKEILRLHDWRFLFNDVTKAKADLLATGNFESVRFWTAINRLESECIVKFSIEERKILEELRYKRNKIEHFHINETVSSLISLSSSVLNLLLRILNENIELNKISPYSKELINQLPKELSGFNVFVNERMRTIKSEFEKKKSEGTRNFLCPSCAQQTFFIDSSLSCLFCNYTNQPEIIASELELVSPEIIEKDGNKCEKCKTLSVIKIEKKQVCLNCITKENNLVIED